MSTKRKSADRLADAIAWRMVYEHKLKIEFGDLNAKRLQKLYDFLVMAAARGFAAGQRRERSKWKKLALESETVPKLTPEQVRAALRQAAPGANELNKRLQRDAQRGPSDLRLR